jgi:hypothetical protein
VLVTHLSEREERADELPSGCGPCDERFATRAELNGRVWVYHELDGDITP